jgi:hypothetical protein
MTTVTANTNLFEQATRAKLRFSSPQGQLSVEDLWDLPLTGKGNQANLDDLYKNQHALVKASTDQVSLVTPTKKVDDVDELKLEVVKHITLVLIAERDAKVSARKRAEQKRHLQSLLAQKELQAMEGQSMDELRAQIAALSDD